MTVLPTVISETELSNSFLSETIQVCIVSHSHQRSMEGMVKLGIGPWRIYNYVDSQGITNTRYRGTEQTFGMVLCLAWTGTMLWEIIEPLEGESIYKDFLDEHGEGIHHVAFSGRKEKGEELPYESQIQEFISRGFPVTQSGVLKKQVQFHYFDTEKSTGTTFEIYDLKGRELPEPDSWFPGPPPH